MIIFLILTFVLKPIPLKVDSQEAFSRQISGALHIEIFVENGIC